LIEISNYYDIKVCENHVHDNMTPIIRYSAHNLRPAFTLHYDWTGWPTAGTTLPPQTAAITRQTAVSWEKDVHMALRGNIERSPEEIALAFQNGLARVAGCRASRQGGFPIGVQAGRMPREGELARGCLRRACPAGAKRLPPMLIKVSIFDLHPPHPTCSHSIKGWPFVSCWIGII